MFELLKIYPKKIITPRRLKEEITRFGYRGVARAGERGDFTQQGAIVDIFPYDFTNPVRIEFEENRIFSLRTFSLSSGKTVSFLEELTLLPRKRSHPPVFKGLDYLPGDLLTSGEGATLEKGDYVVHINFGIGKFLGTQRVETDAGEKECLALEYARGDRLYVPPEQGYLVQKYVGFVGRRPKLYRLGTREWELAKRRARRGIENLAAELLELQAKREALAGFAFSSDSDWQEELEHSFVWQETPDQIKATRRVKNDMERSRPMDRLLCGDVGYGKTEVALRAAFKCVMDNKQVAMLVPTTILAEQHYRTFTERLKDYPLAVQMLSRFRSPAEQRAVIRDIGRGKCDVVIGTHRLLSHDVKFHDLGLVIIDEEQRFGVRHKERLKTLKTQVDVLTLTATPIPRTLYLSLAGAREISAINTPPQDRIPVETYVSEYDEELIRKALERELKRGGQVYFVSPRVKGIEKTAESLRRLVPHARLVIGHGQMREKELEEVMKEFIAGKYDVLVATTIIESGLDIPNVNTIIVMGAGNFGLADLYQLRGRVGRATHQAYAYFLVPPGMPLSPDARRRLRSLEKFTDLGSGFKIAMEDLEIRGAGNLLGVEQSGYIASVGFDLYCRILREAIHHEERR